MSDPIAELLVQFEIHSPDGIRALLDAGIDAAGQAKGSSLVNQLIEMYFRSDRFPDCLRLMLDRGATLDDPKLEAVLLNDAETLRAAIAKDPTLVTHRTTMRCAFTSLVGVTPLHVAAEYGHAAAVRTLLEHGAEVDARAATDANGLNGHTPLFHTVNSNANRSAGVMKLLLDAGADPGVRLAGITWGEGFEWETTCFDVTPISYAQLGLLPQMHRAERDTYDNVAVLLQAAGRRVPPLTNVPNRYLRA